MTTDYERWFREAAAGDYAAALDRFAAAAELLGYSIEAQRPEIDRLVMREIPKESTPYRVLKPLLASVLECAERLHEFEADAEGRCVDCGLEITDADRDYRGDGRLRKTSRCFAHNVIRDYRRNLSRKPRRNATGQPQRKRRKPARNTAQQWRDFVEGYGLLNAARLTLVTLDNRKHKQRRGMLLKAWRNSDVSRIEALFTRFSIAGI